MSRKKQATAPLVSVHEWGTGGPLGVFFTEQDMVDDTWRRVDRDGDRDDVHSLAMRYLLDVRDMKLADRHGEFIRDMIAWLETHKSLTPAQARGVVNVLGGAIWANRQRFRTTLKNSRELGREPFCIVCGRRIKNEKMAARGAGWTCWRRVLGDRLDPATVNAKTEEKL